MAIYWETNLGNSRQIGAKYRLFVNIAANAMVHIQRWLVRLGVADDFGRNPCHGAVLGDIMKYYATSAYFSPFSDMDIAKNLGPGAN